MEKIPLVSIIIVNYNGKTYLEECLSSLEKIDYKNYEIILVDNNSTDTSVEYVKNTYPSITIIKLNRNYGFAEPNNIGAKNAKGDYLLFLNNDTTVNPNFISEMVNVLEQDPQIAICQSLLLKPNGEVDSSGDFVDTLGRAYSSKNKENEVKKILSARGASMMVRKDSFWDLGGFDKRFFASFEDVDLGWRAWIWGYKIVLVPNSIVYHKGGQTVKQHLSEIRFHGVKNSLIIRLTNFETGLATTSIFKTLGVILFRKSFGLSLVEDHEEIFPLPSVKIILRGVMWVAKNFRYVLAKRKNVNSRRKRTTKDLLNLGLITK
jgi:GT2 family glycosyltransferase